MPKPVTASPSAPDTRARVASSVYLHLDELRPNPRNPRAHGDEVKRLARTILRTTWGAPIIAQASTRRIIGGHGRLEAARLILAGLEVDGIMRGGADHRFDRDAPEPGMVPVRLVDVSDAEADAMTLADNARALQGQDDAAALVAMATAAFERGAPTMEDIGLGVAELDALVKAAGDALLIVEHGGVVVASVHRGRVRDATAGRNSPGFLRSWRRGWCPHARGRGMGRRRKTAVKFPAMTADIPRRG